MISWLATIVLALVVARIIWVERKCGRRFKDTLATTNEQIESIKRSATDHYRSKFGRDPTEQFPVVDLGKAAAGKKS